MSLINIRIPNPQKCDIHNEPIAFYPLDPNKQAHCVLCMEEKTGMISVQSQLQKLNAIIQQEIESCCNNNDLLQDWFTYIQNFKRSLIGSLDSILKLITDQMKIVRTNKETLQLLKQSNAICQMTIADVQLKCENFEKQNEQVKNEVKQQLIAIENKFLKKVDELLNLKSQKSKIVNNHEQIVKKQQFEVVQTTSQKKLENTCFAFAFNKETNTLLVGCGKEIILYQIFKGVIFEEKQKLTDHTAEVQCLYCMQQFNSFVSGSADNQIIIWEYDTDKNNYFSLCQLKDHQASVKCVTMNKQEDLLISGSIDSTIKFWNKITSNWSIYQTIDVKGVVCDISLNEQENKLISCMFKLVQILEKGNDNKWCIVQSINADCDRLCFTVGDQFVFHPVSPDKMEVYGYDQSKQKFEKLQEIQTLKLHQKQIIVTCYYIKQLKILIVKYFKHLNIFKINSDGKYLLIKTIEFENYGINGKLSYDGQYLVTWNHESKQVEVSILKFIEWEYLNYFIIF